MVHNPSPISISKPFIISFAVAISIYLIYLHTTSYQSMTQDRQLPKQLDHETLLKLQYPSQSQNLLDSIQPRPKCGRFPQLPDLNVSDTYWQVTNTTNGTFYLFNGYFDDRPLLSSIFNQSSVIRILGLINVIDPVVKTYCQVWYEDIDGPITSSVDEYMHIWPKYWGLNTKGASPYLITCSNPLPGLIPRFVSLVHGEACNYANNLLEIRNRRPKGPRRKFLVSVKGLDFPDDVSRLLVEWFEILKILGVDHVEVFVINVHPNVVFVLKFYESLDFVTIKFLRYPHELPNKVNESWTQWSQNDLVPYHDSFYENLYVYEYLVPMDIDEFIVPLNTADRTWADLLQRTMEKAKMERPEPFDAYPVMNMYFLLKSVHENETIDGIPKDMRFLSNIYRSSNFTPDGGNAKTFMSLDRVMVVHNHFPKDCISSNDHYCHFFDVRKEDGQLAHYRVDCDNPECKASKSNPVRDTTLWKYKDEILIGFNETMEKLKEFKTDVKWSPR